MATCNITRFLNLIFSYKNHEFIFIFIVEFNGLTKQFRQILTRLATIVMTLDGIFFLLIIGGPQAKAFTIS